MMKYRKKLHKSMQPTPVTRVCYLSPILLDQSSYVISPHPAQHKRHGRAVLKYSTVGYSIFKVRLLTQHPKSVIQQNKKAALMVNIMSLIDFSLGLAINFARE